MRKDTKDKFISYGFDTSLIEKIEKKGLSLTLLKTMDKQRLKKADFTEEETNLIIKKLRRNPIDKDILNSIIEKSGGVCCFCKDGINNRAYQIHHIEEHHISQDNSEANLLLVCPNHHVEIHKNNKDKETQKQIKRIWENLWAIAKLYQTKGISFPFGAIEYIDYGHDSKITEVLRLFAPSPALCLTLCEGSSIAEGALKKLQKHNHLIIAGVSGSGKTTLALGLAGKCQGRKVFKYEAKTSKPTGESQQVLHFLSENVGKVVLIIDDVNTKFNPDQIQTILQSANKDKWVIVVNTRNELKNDDNNLEQHFSNAVAHINWHELKESVKTSLLSKEKEIVDYLHDNNLDNFNGNRIGFQPLQTTLERAINEYSRTAQNAWQFTYLLGGGLQQIEDFLKEFFDRDRLDIVFLFISIKQISEVERGTSIDEILDLYGSNSILKQDGMPKKECLEEQLEGLCKRRVLNKQRGRYKTIHRLYAREVIDKHASCFPDDGCTELLDEVFRDKSKIKEIVILWSWLANTNLQHYLKSWYTNLPEDDWLQYAIQAANTSLDIFTLFIRQIKSIGRTPIIVKNVQGKKTFTRQPSPINETLIIDNIIKTPQCKSQLASLINQTDVGCLYYLYNLLSEFDARSNDNRKPNLVNLLDKVNKGYIQTQVKKSEVVDFSFINQLFQQIYDFYPTWVTETLAPLNRDDLKGILEKHRKGDLANIHNTLYVFRRYVLNLKRSDMKYYVDLMAHLITDCSLKDMVIFESFPNDTFKELFLYKEELNKILSAIDIAQIAVDIVSLPPRYWQRLKDILILSVSADSDCLQNIIDDIDETLLAKNIEKYYLENSHDLRILMLIFCHGQTTKKQSIAEVLKPYISSLLEHKGLDVELLNTYYTLDQNLAREVVKENQYKITLEVVNLPVASGNSGYTFKQIEELEESGDDYFLKKWRPLLPPIN